MMPFDPEYPAKPGTECCSFEHSSGNIVHYVVTCGNSRTTSVSSSVVEARRPSETETEMGMRVEIYGRTAVDFECPVAISNAAAYEGPFGLIA